MRARPPLLTWPFRACFSARWIAFVPILALTAIGVLGVLLGCLAVIAWGVGPLHWLAELFELLGVLAFCAFFFGVPYFGLLMLVGGCWSATGKRKRPGGWAVAFLGPSAAALLWIVGLWVCLLASIFCKAIIEERQLSKPAVQPQGGTPPCRASCTSTSMS